MSKNTILAYLNSGRKDAKLIITWYCLEKGKDPELIRKFTRALELAALYGAAGEYASLLEYCYDYALTYYLMKYNIILLYDKHGKFIKVF